MRIRAELHCYHCGYVAASVEGERDRPLAEARLIPSAIGPGLHVRRGQSPRCGRCGGPLYLTDIEVATMRPEAEVAAWSDERQPALVAG